MKQDISWSEVAKLEALMIRLETDVEVQELEELFKEKEKVV